MHRGSDYPFNNRLRLYAGDDSWEGLIPLLSWFEIFGLRSAATGPINVPRQSAFPVAWTPGDFLIEYRSSPFMFGAFELEVGWQIEIDATTLFRWVGTQLWCFGVEQLERRNVPLWGGFWDVWGTFTPGIWKVPGALVWVDNSIVQHATIWSEIP